MSPKCPPCLGEIVMTCSLGFMYKISFKRDVDEMSSEAGMSEEKAQRAMIDAARLADEVRDEPQHIFCTVSSPASYGTRLCSTAGEREEASGSAG